MNWDDTFRRIIDAESFQTSVYLDKYATTPDYPNGVPTVGPGIALFPGTQLSVSGLMTIANDKFRQCIHDFQRLETVYGLSLDSVRRSVITEMIWNMGFRGVCRFRKMIGAMQGEDWPRAADEIIDSAVHRKLSEIRGNRKFKIRTEIWAGMMREGEE